MIKPFTYHFKHHKEISVFWSIIIGCIFLYLFLEKYGEIIGIQSITLIRLIIFITIFTTLFVYFANLELKIFLTTISSKYIFSNQVRISAFISIILGIIGIFGLFDANFSSLSFENSGQLLVWSFLFLVLGFAISSKLRSVTESIFSMRRDKDIMIFVIAFAGLIVTYNLIQSKFLLFSLKTDVLFIPIALGFLIYLVIRKRDSEKNDYYKRLHNKNPVIADIKMNTQLLEAEIDKLIENGDYLEAQKQLLKVQAKKKYWNGSAHFQFGMILCKRRKFAKALFHLQTALIVDRKNPNSELLRDKTKQNIIMIKNNMYREALGKFHDFGNRKMGITFENEMLN